VQQLEKLRILLRRRHLGELQGENRSSGYGMSMEFSDYRQYYPGDDYRYIDWNILSRLDRLVVKLFASEQDRKISILIDTSRSMETGKPSKLGYAMRLAAALAYIALADMNRIEVGCFSSGLNNWLPGLRGRSSIFQVFDFLRSAKPGGKTDLVRSLHEFGLRTRYSGLVIILTDLLVPGNWEPGLRYLNYRNNETALIQILSPVEVDPDLAGAYRFIDSETGEQIEVDVDAAAIQQYRNDLQAWLASLKTTFSRLGIDYIRTVTSLPFEKLVLYYLRQGGLLS